MDQIKIGKLIAECRKAQNLTQVELANLLGVSDKSVSKWERGICLPDVSLYPSLCKILNITLNEFFAGCHLTDENFKEAADNNLLNALENSVFTLKDKVEFFKNKWQKDHFFELIIVMIIIVFLIIYSFIKNNGYQYLFIIMGFISGIIENNKMMAYVEKNAYGNNSKASDIDFKAYLKSLEEFKEKMLQFKNKKEAVNYLVKETGLKKQDCSEAYDMIMQINLTK